MAGTEFGFYVSFDEGGSWQAFMNNCPPRGSTTCSCTHETTTSCSQTHGRSVLIMDDISALQALTPEVLASDVHLFEPRDAVLWKEDRTTGEVRDREQDVAG